MAGPAWAQEGDQPEIPSQISEGNCVVCHAQHEVVQTSEGVREELLVSPATVAASVHADFSCTDCHSPLVNTLHPETDMAAGACAECHEPEATEYRAGAHGKSQTDGTPPTCVTCHGNHAVTEVTDTGFTERLADRCAECHAAMSERGFGSNPLGMETHLGRADLATCDDCHEAHRVLPPDDPMSTVHEANKLQTCRRCHHDAPANFREIQVHVASGPLPDDTKLRLATLWMLGILIFTFAFFGWLTVLGIRHEWRHGRHQRHRATEGGAP